MKGFTKIASIFALALIVLALPSIGSAQNRNRDRDDDYYGRNDDNYRNGGYNNNRNIRGTVQSLRNRARNFERRIDRIDDRNNGRYGNNRYDNLEELSDRFARATDKLAGAYGQGRNMNNSRDEARRVLDIGSQIENILRNGRGNRNASGEWNQISRDLRIIANAYNLNYYNGGRNQNTDWRNRVPFPLPF